MSKILFPSVLIFLCFYTYITSAVQSDDIVEGDIKLEKSKFKSVGESDRQWPGGVIPYELDRAYDTREREIIMGAMDLITRKTNGCIRFVPRDNTQRSWLSITSLDGCWSYVGKIRGYGAQQLSIQRGGCTYKGTVVHEICHALGFYHEQNRPDRDDYVQINRENIAPSAISNFNKYDKPTFNTPYDYYSIMHYDEYAFSINNKKTIVPLQQGVELSSSYSKTDAQILSYYDILAIKTLYQCNTVPTTKPTTPKPTTPKPTTPKATTPKPTTPKATTPKATTPKATKPIVATTSVPLYTKFNLVLRNNYSIQMYLYWINYSGIPKYFRKVNPRSTITQQTYTGHKWILVTSNFKYISQFKIGQENIDQSNKKVYASQLSFRRLN